MALITREDPSQDYVETVEEIMKIFKWLPPRPSTEEVEAAISVIKTVNYEEQQRLEEIASQVVPQDVPPEIFSVLQQVQKTMVFFQIHEQRNEAIYLVEIAKIFQTFDGLIQRASELVSGDTHVENQLNFDSPDVEIGQKFIISDTDEALIRNEESKKDDPNGFLRTAPSELSSVLRGEDTEKLSLMKVAEIFDVKAKAEVLDLQGKLMDKVEWLPISLGKLSNIVELNLADNQIMALPSTMGSLGTLKKLDIHSNQLINLPGSFGELLSLTDLDLHANRLRSLPASFGNLTDLINLDLSSNQFKYLPDLIGNLTSLKRLNVETNDLEELPYTIGSCFSLVELRLDFNQLKALPEVVGELELLEILTLRYNRIKGLPITIGNLLLLKELNVSFNELETMPENLCFAVGLEKLNVGSNFADLRALPKSIGNLQMLEELDISNNQIQILPDSFRYLSKLKVFNADETPLEVPPRRIAKLGPQAVVQYMTDFVAERDMKFPKPTKRGICLLFAKCLGIEM